MALPTQPVEPCCCRVRARRQHDRTTPSVSEPLVRSVSRPRVSLSRFSIPWLLKALRSRTLIPTRGRRRLRLGVWCEIMYLVHIMRHSILPGEQHGAPMVCVRVLQDLSSALSFLSAQRGNRNGGPSAFCGVDDYSGFEAFEDPEEYERCKRRHDARCVLLVRSS